MTAVPPWSQRVRLSEAQRGLRIPLVADAAARSRVADLLDLPALTRLEGEVRLRPWLDGAALDGRWSADFAQTCSVTAEPFDQSASGTFQLRAVPSGSVNAPTEEIDGDVDPEADDPPDVLDGEEIDIAAYLVEHFALELDPFPRAPGAVFAPPPEPAEPSPFAALAALKRPT